MTTPIPLSTPTTDPALAYKRAYARAVAERTRAWRTSEPRLWTVRTQTSRDDGSAHRYAVRETGVLSTDLLCACPAGSHGRTCKHTVTVAEARHRGWDAICMDTTPAPAAAHCARCGCWYAVADDDESFLCRRCGEAVDRRTAQLEHFGGVDAPHGWFPGCGD